MSKAAADMLRAARAKIERPEAWTQGAMSRVRGDAYGGSVTELSDCYCVNGALFGAALDIARAAEPVGNSTGVLMASGASAFLSSAAVAAGFETASKFNDAKGRTHAEVLALYDRAIAMAEAAP